MDYEFSIQEISGALHARYQVINEYGEKGPRRRVRLWPAGKQPYKSRLSKKALHERAREVIEKALTKAKESPKKSLSFDPKGKVATLGQWLERGLLDPGIKGYTAERSLDCRDDALKKFVHWCHTIGMTDESPITTVNPALMQRYADDLIKGGIKLPSGRMSKPKKPWSLRRDISPIQRAFNWLLENEDIVIVRNPVKVKIQQFHNAEEQRQRYRDRSVDMETLEVLLENCHGTLKFDNRGTMQEMPMTTCYMHPLIMLMSHSGMRTGEARQAKWREIDWDSNVIRITQGKTKNRAVPMPESLKVYLRERLENLKEVGVKTEYILCLEDGSQLNHHSIGQAFRRYCNRIGVDKSVTLYGLRHHFAHRCADNGVPITHLQSFMGHSNLKTTQVYTHSEVENVMDSLKGVF